MRIEDLETPALLLDCARMDRNIARMREHLARLHAPLRPHVKTAKSLQIVNRARQGQPGGITVSTLKEAEYFFEQGMSDILYAVGISPGKLDHAAALLRRGADLMLVVDNLAAARLVGEAASKHGAKFSVLIELDVDGHRSGVQPESQLLIDLGGVLASTPGVQLRGVMTHAGDSYNCRSVEALRSMAARERDGAVRAATRLREHGLPCPVVSVGSTPTATFAESLSGITEVRAGVYLFQDLVMAGLGVCGIEDIAISVLVTVIGHQSERGWIITDGGWMALSSDRGTASQPIDQGYGIVCDAQGHPFDDDLIVMAANQEHGIVARRNRGPLDLGRYPVGIPLRVLPNHACATAAQHECYRVVSGDRPEIIDTWPRINGW
jgi:D-serine deaminase-like pyridoxal phosphate-dependent protein